LDLLDSYGLLGSEPTTTPLSTSLKLHQDTSKPFVDVSCYRGSLEDYCIWTLQDLIFL